VRHTRSRTTEIAMASLVHLAALVKEHTHDPLDRDVMAAVQAHLTRLGRWCSECGARFRLNDGQVEWFLGRGWSLPRRCPQCRQARRPAPDAPRSDTARCHQCGRSHTSETAWEGDRDECC